MRIVAPLLAVENRRWYSPVVRRRLVAGLLVRALEALDWM
jgi:hypothetical protein